MFLIKRFSIEVSEGLKIANSERRSMDKYSLAKSRNTFIPLFLSMEQSPSIFDLITEYITEMPVNFDNSDLAFPTLFEKYISKASKSYSSNNYVALLKAYLRRQNPRLYIALNTSLSQYRNFLRGSLNENPLCLNGLANVVTIKTIYQQELNDSDKAFLDKECTKLNAFKMKDFSDSSNIHIAPFNSLDPDKYFSDLKNQFALQRDQTNAQNAYVQENLKADMEWVKALSDLKANLGSDQFDALDLYGLKSTDLPFYPFVPSSLPQDPNI